VSDYLGHRPSIGPPVLRFACQSPRCYYSNVACKLPVFACILCNLIFLPYWAGSAPGLELTAQRLCLRPSARKYRFQANVVKCAIVVFGDSEPVTDQWDSYVYLGVHFDRSCTWDLHATEIAQSGMSKLKKLKHVFTNKHLSTEIKRTILLSVLKPSLTYAGDVWEPTKDVGDQLESVIIDACKDILQCGDRTSAEAIRGDMGILPLKTERVIQKLKLKYLVSRMPDHRYPKIVTEKNWPSIRRGRQPKVWSCMTSDLLKKYLLPVSIYNRLRNPPTCNRLKIVCMPTNHSIGSLVCVVKRNYNYT
jgi:hypothetical protein